MAAEDYTKAIELDANNLSVYFMRGMAYERSNSYKEAVDDFSTVIQRQKNPPNPAYFFRAEAYSRLGKYQDAINDFTYMLDMKDVKSDEQYMSECYFNRALCYTNLGQYEQALNDLSCVIDIDPDDVQAYHYRAMASLKNDDLLDYISDIGMVRRLDPEYYEEHLGEIEAEDE